MKVKTKEILAVFILFFILSLIFTYPLIQNIKVSVPSLHRIPRWVEGDSDVWLFIWNMWWVKHALSNKEESIFKTNYLFFPHSIYLKFHSFSLFNSLTGVVIYRFLHNWLLVYNLLFLLSYLLTGVFTFLFLRKLTDNFYGALLGSIIVTFSSYHVLHSLEHLNLMSIQWIPISMLCFINYRENKRWLWLIMGIGVLLINFFISYYYALLIILFFIVFVLSELVNPFVVFKEKVLNCKYMTLFTIVSLALLLIISLIMMNEIYENKTLAVSTHEKMLYSADLLSFFLPTPLHPILGKWSLSIFQTLPGNFIEKAITPGIVVIILLFFDLIITKFRNSFSWIITSLIFVILSLGPYLSYNGHLVKIAGKKIILPFYLLQNAPFFEHFRAPARFTIIAQFGFAVCIAFFIKYLLSTRFANSKISERNVKFSFKVFYLILIFLILFEYWSDQLPLLKGEIHRAYKQIAFDNKSEAVLEVPLDPRIRRYQYNQTLHGHPLLSGYVARLPTSLIEKTLENPLLRYLSANYIAGGIEHIRKPTEKEFLASIKLYHINYIIIHKNYLPYNILKNYLNYFKTFQKHAIFDDNELLIFYFQKK